MTIVYRWMGFPERVVQVMEQVMCGWQTRPEVIAEGKKRQADKSTYGEDFFKEIASHQ